MVTESISSTISSQEGTVMGIDEITNSGKDYDTEFWNKAMRGKPADFEKLKGGRTATDMFTLPYESNRKYMAELEKESIFRQFATSINVSSSNNTVLAYASDDVAACVPGGESINVSDLADDFTRIKTEAHKVVSLVKVANAFVTDNAFDIKKHLPKRFAKVFGRAEENLFINGTGVGQPVGILNDTLGAETGVTTTDVTFDDVINLYMSVKAKHRKHGVWLMNDETALALRKLKDKDGNYLWQENMDTILGKPVYISEFMPSIATGKKVIAFGDFSYYWILNRRPLAVRALKEKFELYDQTGYLGMEYIDGKLVNREAIKVMQIS